MDYLDDRITEAGASAYLIYASSDDPDMRYLTRFVTHDPVIILKKPGEELLMIVPQMEAERAEQESTASIITRQQAGYHEISETEKDPVTITAKMIERLVHGPVIVPASFPIGLARTLESFIPVLLDKESSVKRARAIKKPDEIEWIRSVQRATEMAMDHAIMMIRGSDIRNGELYHDDIPLTSERIKIGKHKLLLDRGCTSQDTIVASGPETSMPHCTGSGILKSNQPIVIDIFPRSELTGYFADMTRTVSKGEPDSNVTELYRSVKEALILGESGVKTGASGVDLYQSVRTFFEEQGFASGTEGFTHSLGHGVGLEVHEAPSLSPVGTVLQPGEVITIEPGLYYRGIGGVRIENMGVVRNNGFERMTSFSMDMVL